MGNIITIDIGNTRAKYAIFNKEDIIETSTFNPYSDDLKYLIDKYPNIDKGIISSVGGKIEECKAQLNDIDIVVLSGETPLPFTTRYDNKKQIGSDRLVAVAAAMKEKNGQNNLVIDIGTCITYDIITAEKEHHAGPISPGINLRFKSMHDYTEKLPLIESQNLINSESQNFVCDNTRECLESGVTNGILYEIEGFIKEYTSIYKEINTFITGGDNIFFENKLKNCIFANSKFTFNGLKFILDYQ